ncbi:phage baseplate plug family protein [Levilactobacillus brevis]|uniref:phage baseplate plug family protein n=1 Tax=Levilactobacillus brevis TaxID=1580 RepID=UPI0031E283BF
MPVRPYIDFDVDDLPETFEQDLDGTTYLISLAYNDEGDFFVFTLMEDDETPIVSEKLILNQPLFQELPPDERLPTTPLAPMDESGQAKRVSIDNFMDTVFLCEDVLPNDGTDIGELPIDGDWTGGLDG